jgi:hypothetical protein
VCVREEEKLAEDKVEEGDSKPTEHHQQRPREKEPLNTLEN